MTPFWYVGFNQIESPCNNSEKHCFKFQKNRTVNKNNGNFEMAPPISPPKSPFIVFGPKRNLVPSLLILNKRCMQQMIEIVRAVCKIFPKCCEGLTFRETGSNIQKKVAYRLEWCIKMNLLEIKFQSVC